MFNALIEGLLLLKLFLGIVIDLGRIVLSGLKALLKIPAGIALLFQQTGTAIPE